ncbi:unnamed protein product [Cylindrotheca closterium]|uniref:Uncharacterized protein n=1 Tax=Cylindrotheca closterium TaxID=2856 RepID=A0AAD2G5D0_9STRA|nr:unnamed protein product [Cylindrotheca closterium]
MSSTITIEYSTTGIDKSVDPFDSDDFSILSFGDADIQEDLDEFGCPPSLNREQSTTPTDTPPPPDIETIRSIPISDDESTSGTSLFSDTSLQFLSNPQSPKSSELHDNTSLEEMVVKLNRSMIRSARSRAMISKAVFPDLRKQGLKRNKKPIMLASKSSLVHKVQRSTATAKHTYSNSSGFAKSSLLDFLRATKKW